MRPTEAPAPTGRKGIHQPVTTPPPVVDSPGRSTIQGGLSTSEEAISLLPVHGTGPDPDREAGHDPRTSIHWRPMPRTIDPITQRHIENAADALVDEFAGIFSRETITRYIGDSLALLGNARFSDFLPVLAHRFARERLRALGQSEGTIVREMPEVLFVCVQNAGRSQMAAGLLKLRSEDRIHVRSAGSSPGELINPLVVAAMSELGVDLSQAFPKPLTDEVVRAADVVITMGCGDACPIYPGKRYEDWVLDDPAEAGSLEDVRAIRDEIDRRVQHLVGELV